MKLKTLALFFIFNLTTFVVLSSPAQTAAVQTTEIILKSQDKVARQILKKNKFSKKFREDLLKNYDTESFHTTARLNILGFLNPPNHQNLVTEEAAIKTEEFMIQNKKTLAHVEKKYAVTSSVIASLLWIETRHGQLTGKYHVGSVYLHMAQLTRPDIVKGLTQIALAHEKAQTDKKFRRRIPKLIKERTARRAKWAVEQLKALEKIHKRDAQLVNQLKGSFAGAFGIPQFIPSSYNTYARSFVAGKVPDLYKVEDAVTSVGNYLRKEGFKKKNRKAQMKALMHYNNSEDYALSILDLSQRLLIQKK